MQKRSRDLVVFVAVLALLGGACSGKTSSKKSRPATESPSQASPTPLLDAITCLPVSDPAFGARPALGVKIENTPDARPQSGIDLADVVYEELVEGGITRFLTVYHSRNASDIGPVRSARWVDADVLRNYGTPLFAYSGAADAVLQKLHGSRLIALDETAGGRAYHRVGFRAAPHNLYANTAGFFQVAGRKGRPIPGPIFPCGDLMSPPMNGSPSPAVSGVTPSPARWPTGMYAQLPFSSSYVSIWRYDAGLGKYLRFQGGQPHRMRSGVQLAFKNVLVLFVDAHLAAHIAKFGSLSPLTTVTGSGRAVLLRDGVRVDGTWHRGTLDDLTTFTDAQGRSFEFAPGTTFVELFPRDLAASFVPPPARTTKSKK